MQQADLIKLKSVLMNQSGLDLAWARSLLEAEIVSASSSWGTPLMLKGLALALYLNGAVEDASLIWRAKMSNFDCFTNLDVEFLAGAGYDVTISYLKTQNLEILPTVQRGEICWDMLSYMMSCADAGDFTHRDPAYIRAYINDVLESIDELESEQVAVN